MRTGFIVKLVIALLFFVALMPRACAQVMLPHRKTVPAVGAGAWTPQSIPTIRYWWVSEDLLDGAVATWTDRIQGAISQQDDAGSRPVKGSSGVFFAGTASSYLTNNPVFVTTNAGYPKEMTIFVIQKPHTTNTFAGLLGAIDASAGNGYGQQWGSGNHFWSGSVGSIQSPPVLDGVLHDYVGTVGPDGGSGFTNIWYTNGVLGAVSGSTGLWQTNMYFGKFAAGTTFYKGFVSEIAFFSNALTAADILKLHQYGALKYGY